MAASVRERERFGLLDLVDENGFRITVQHQPECRREAEPGQLVDLELLDPVDAVRDGILDRRQAALGCVHRSHRGVERRRPTGTGRTADDDEAARLADRVGVPRPLVVGEAEHLDVRDAALTVEQPEHTGVVVRGRQDGDTDVDLALLDADREAAFARDTRPADIHPREDLHAVDQRTQRRQRRVRNLAQDAVDAEPDAQLVRERFDVDVRRAFADRLLEEHAGEADDRFVLLGQRGRGRDGLRCGCRGVAGRCRARLGRFGQRGRGRRGSGAVRSCAVRARRRRRSQVRPRSRVPPCRSSD